MSDSHSHGGARPGAGRKPHREKYEREIASFHDQAAAGIDARYAALQLLADGGFEQVSETWEPAGLIYVSKQVETKEGTIKVSELAFPELDPTELVCVRRVRSIAAPDLKANVYLVDRLAGKPVQATEISGPDGGPLLMETLSDEQRAHRVAELLERARARRAGLPADDEPGDAA